MRCIMVNIQTRALCIIFDLITDQRIELILNMDQWLFEYGHVTINLAVDRGHIIVDRQKKRT